MDSKDYKQMEKAMDDFINSPEGEAYFENIGKQLVIKQGRYRRFEKYLETHNFDELMQRLVAENGKDWCDKCYEKGYQPYPNNKLEFLIDYITHNYESVSVPKIESEHFTNQTWFFKGYYVNMMRGQGVFTQVFDNNLNRIIAL